MSDNVIDSTLHHEQTRNEKVVAWVRAAMVLSMTADILTPEIPALVLWIDAATTAYLLAALGVTYLLARRRWFKYVILTTDVAVILFNQFAYRAADPQARLAFLTLLLCIIVTTASLRLDRRAVSWSVVLGLAALGSSVALRRQSLLNLSAAVVIFMVFGAMSYYVMHRMRRMLEQVGRNEQLARFLPPELAEQAMQDPAFLRLGGRRQSVTMLFADIRGFSELAEGREPEQVIALLNDYFHEASEAIFAHRGTLDKFMGDALLALFGAPLTHPDDADRAVAAAVEIMHRLGRLNARLAEAGQPAIQIGIGINTAPVIAGNVGTDRRMDYTVIGDGVNVAARLEKLTKDYDTKIIISQSTWEHLTDKRGAVSHGQVTLPGRRGGVEIFGLQTPV